MTSVSVPWPPAASAPGATLKDDVQRHQCLQRMRPGVDERPDVLADQTATAHRDQLLRRATLLGGQAILLCHGVEVGDDAIAQVAAVPHLEEQPVQTVRVRRRVLVELESLVP